MTGRAYEITGGPSAQTVPLPGGPGAQDTAILVPEVDSPLAEGMVAGGRYQILRAAHRSGMSTVYRAVDLRDQQGTVALKQFSSRGLPAAERQECLGWLAREAGLLSSLNNTHLPTLLAAFSEGDDHFLVMPYLVGKTLKERVAVEGPLPESDVVQWAVGLTQVLAYLHGQQPPIVHRDLKPDNIMILHYDQRPVLLDLGVATPLRRNGAGTAIGTPGYAAPEQYQGLADERSDLYALGATMHYMLTGYEAETQAPFRHPEVRDVRPEISPDLANLVRALLRMAPGQRPADAWAVAAYLASLDAAPTLQRYSLVRRRYLVRVAAPAAGLVALAVWGPPPLSGFMAVIPLLVLCSAFLVLFFAGRGSCKDEREEQARQQVSETVSRLLVPGALGLTGCYLLLPHSIGWLLAWALAPVWLAMVPLQLTRCTRAMEAGRRQARLRLGLPAVA